MPLNWLFSGRLMWCILCCLLLQFDKVFSDTVTWKEDSVDIVFGNTTFVGPTSNTTLDMSGYSVNVTVASNGQIYDDGDDGHFRLKFYIETSSYGDLSGTTECLPIHKNQDILQQTLLDSKLWLQNGTVHYFDFDQIVTSLKVKKFRHTYSTVSVVNSFIVTLDGKEVKDFNTYITKSGCRTPRTQGNWNDPLQWSNSVVPNATDDVVIPAGAGVIYIDSTENITIQSFTTHGGDIIMHRTICPDGWTSNPEENPARKCYRKFETPLDFDSADGQCAASLYGSMDSHLVQISNAPELKLVQRLCRGKTDTITTYEGCWIGLRDTEGIGQYNWIEPESSGGTYFRDWRRYEWNNHTFSEGESTNGELCVQMVPWESDALIFEQGSFNDVACKLEKPYICQIFAYTKRASLYVNGSTMLNGGGISGGELYMLGPSDIELYYGHNAAKLSLEPSAGNYNNITTVYLEAGSSLSINANITTSKTAYIGEYENLQNTSDVLDMQTLFYMGINTYWNINGSNYNVDMYARANIMGTVYVDQAINFNLRQGGALSQSSFVLTGNATYLNLGGGSQLSTFDSFQLEMRHRGPVIGEYVNEIAHEITDPTTGLNNITGIFRFRVYNELINITTIQTNTSTTTFNSTDNSTTTTYTIGSEPYANVTNEQQISKCVPYHATAQEVADVLADLSLVSDRGGVTVRRYGDGDLESYGYGYSWRIEMDAPPTSAYDDGPLHLEVYCYGIHDCGCAETKVPLEDATGQRMCPRILGNSSRIDGDSCVTAPEISIERMTTLSYTETVGSGSLVIDSGSHRLPPRSGVLISSASTGIGIVGADVIEWGGIAVDGIGTLVVCGTGWASWDSATNIFGPSWWDIRGYVHMLETAPAFDMTVDEFYLSSLGSILTASPHSNMTWNSGTWNGGTIGGRCRLNILGNVSATGTNKALRYGITVYIGPEGRFTWTEGNISLANGASIIVEGTFDLQTVGLDMAAYIGESHLLDSANADYLAMLVREDPIQWHGYFGLEIPAELRGGWYRNPLCGDQCDRENYMWVRGNGRFLFAEDSNTSFNLPVNFLGESRVVMGYNSTIEMASGGICGNQVVVNISTGTTFSFSGGNMAMRATCKVQGEGELMVSGGAHDMSFSIDAHITIAGGVLIWPFSRGTGQTITFRGGLTISNEGKLQIEPYSTNIIVYGVVYFKDDSLLQFPMMGIAANPSNSDRPDAPDVNPRGSLTAVDLMRWEGGTLRGKADFISENQLFMSGGLKRIRSLAKVVNKGYAEWDTGDIVMADNADFMNLGTVQMAYGNEFFKESLYYQGSIVPIESGGDVFAKDFHSYEVDGKLDYSVYVDLRTEYVSRAPVGWEESDQDLTIRKPTNII
jgi:hypothetical protein